jgi:2-alkenal reductase
MRKIRQVLLYSLIASLFLAMGFVLAINFVPQHTVSAIGEETPSPNIESVSLSEQERIFEHIYDTVAPSVVSIVIEGRRNSEDVWKRLSSGSGFVIDTDGHIVSNYHVIANTDDITQLLGPNAEGRISASLFDGTIVEADVIGRDPQSDLAVIHVNVAPERLHPITFGDSEALHEGQFVFAIGNPFSNDWTLTSGIISALNRSIPGLDIFSIGGVIQTDAAINPGNSGGPLVTLAAQVVGVNSQINTDTGVNTGVGFAIPSNLVVKVADMLIREGEMHYSYLGIDSDPIDLSFIESYDLPNNIRGVPITKIQRNGAAATAGLRAMSENSLDIITAVDGIPTANFDEMIAYLSIHTSPGDTVILTVYRNGEILELSLTLTDRP